MVPDILVDDRSKKANFINLPTKKADIIKQTINDSHHQPIVELQKNGRYLFRVYDSCGKKRMVYKLMPADNNANTFTVYGYQHNPFGEVERVIKYADKITIDNVDKYYKTGIPLDIVYQKVKPLESNKKNRTTKYTRDNRGDIIKIEKDEVPYYYPGSRKLSMGNPQITYVNDAFRKPILIIKRRFLEYEVLDYCKRQWFDRNKNLVAEAETIQSELKNDSLLETPVVYRVTRYLRNTFNKEQQITEFANPIVDKLTEKVSLSELDELCEKQRSLDDRIIQKEYNLLGKLEKTIRIGMVTQVGSLKEITNSFKDKTGAIFAHVRRGLEALQKNSQKNAQKKKNSGEDSTKNGTFVRQVKHDVGTNFLYCEFNGWGKGQDQRRFQTHYTHKICNYLINFVSNKAECFAYVFDVSNTSSYQQKFKRQFIALKQLSDQFKKPAIFINQLPDDDKSKSGKTTNEKINKNRFILCCYSNNNLLWIDPRGNIHTLTDKNNRNLLFDLQQKYKLNICIPAIKLQHDPSMQCFSSGPIVIELAAYLMGDFTNQQLQESIEKISSQNLYSIGKLKYSLALPVKLPTKLMQLLDDSEDLRAYVEKITSIRQLQGALLKIMPVNLASHTKTRISEIQSVCLNSPLKKCIEKLLLKRLSVKKMLEIEPNVIPRPSLLTAGFMMFADHFKKTHCKKDHLNIKPKTSNAKPEMHDTPPEDVVEVENFYTPIGKIYCTKDALGNSKYQTHDARGFCIAHTDTPRSGKDGDTDIPLTYTGINAHGQNVLETRFVNGALAEETDYTTIPKPKKEDPGNDQKYLNYFDNRGLITIKQNPLGYLKVSLYTTGGRLTRKFWLHTTRKKVSLHSSVEVKYIVENQWDFDNREKPISMLWLANDISTGIVSQIRRKDFVYNTFGDDISQTTTSATTKSSKNSFSDISPDTYHKLDNLGQEFNTNNNKNNDRLVPTVLLRDLMGKPTAEITSTEIDIRTEINEPEDIAKLFAKLKKNEKNEKGVQLTEYYPDTSEFSSRRVLRTVLPPFTAHRTDIDPKKIPTLQLCMQVSNHYSQQIGKTSITWPKLQDTAFKQKFYLWQSDEQPPIEPMTIKEYNEIVGVDVSNLITDVYNYRIDFIMINPITAKEEIYYQTLGQIQFDTGIYENKNSKLQLDKGVYEHKNSQLKSRRVVTEMRDGHVLWISGNVVDVTAIQLWQNDKLINQFDISDKKSGETYSKSINLKDKKDKEGNPLVSGIYQAKCVRNDKVDEKETLDFTLYTDVSSPTPLSRSISCQAQLVTEGKNGELSIWNSLPLDYQKMSVQLTCDYDYYINDLLKGGGLYIKSVTTDEEYKEFIADWKKQHKDTMDVLLIRVTQSKTPGWTVCGIRVEKSGEMSEETQEIRIDEKSALGQILEEIKNIDEVTEQQKAELFRLSTYMLGRALFVTETHNMTNLDPNIEFGHTINQIITITIVLLLNDNAKIMLYMNSMPISTQDQLVIEHNRPKVLQVRKSLNRNLPSNKRNSTGTVWHFLPQETVYITSPLARNPKNIHFWDISKGFEASWQEKEIMLSDKAGFTIDVTGLMSSAYYYWIDDKLDVQTFTVTEGMRVYTSDKGDNKPCVVETQIKNDNGLDVFNNVVKKIETSSGKEQITMQKVNVYDKVIEVTFPKTTVIDPQTGNISQDVFTIQKYGYNKIGQKIGETDPNGNTRLFTLNPDGLSTSQILPDSALSYQDYFNCLKQNTEHLDSRSKLFKMEYNRVNSIIKYTRPNGDKPLVELYGYDEEENRIYTKNASGHESVNGFDMFKNLVLRQDPVGTQQTTLITEYKHHFSGEVCEQINPDGGKLTWDRDPAGIELARTLLDGTKIISTLNNNKQKIREISTGGTTRDCIKCVAYTKHYFNFPVNLYRFEVNKVPQRDLGLQYNNDLLVKVIDKAGNKLLTYTYDELGRRIGAILEDGDSGVKRVMNTRYDGKGNQIYVFDSNAVMSIMPDKAGNRIYIHAVFTCNSQTIVNDSWNMPDVANRMLISGGVWKDNKITIIDGKGFTLGFKDGFRVTEGKIVSGVKIDTQINYDDSGREISTQGSNKTSTITQYNNDSDIVDAEQRTPMISKKQAYSFDVNNLLLTHIPYENGIWKQEMYEQSYTLTGNVLSELIKLPDQEHAHNIQVHTNFHYQQLDYEREMKVDGWSYYDEGGSKQSTPASRMVGAYCEPNAKFNFDQSNANGGQNFSIFGTDCTMYLSTYESVIFSLRHINIFSFILRLPKVFINDELIFNGPDGRPFSGYTSSSVDPTTDEQESAKTPIKDSSKALMPLNYPGEGEVSSYSYSGAVNQVSLHGGSWGTLAPTHLGRVFGRGKRFVVYDAVKSVANYDKPHFEVDFLRILFFRKAFVSTPKACTSSPITPCMYIAERNNMTLAEIASVNNLNPQTAVAAIARENGWPISKRVMIGVKVRIPNMQMNTDSFNDLPNNMKLMHALLGNLTPKINFAQPKQHRNCKETVLRVVIPLVAIGLSLVFPPAIGLASGANLAGELVAGLFAGMFDALGQELAIKVGALHNFSWGEVLETAAAAALQKSQIMQGLNKDFKGAITAEKIQVSKVMTILTKAVALQGALNVSLQLTELATGIKKKFDVKSLLTVMATAALDMGINNMVNMPPANDIFTQELENKVTGFANDFIGNAIMGGGFHFDQILEQELGTTIGDVTNYSIDKGMHTVDNKDSKAHKPPKVENARTSIDEDYAHAHTNGQGYGQKNSYISQSPDVQNETTGTKYHSSVTNTTNKPVTSTNRAMVKSMDLPHQDSYVIQTKANTWEFKWVDNVLNKNRSFNSYINNYTSQNGLQVQPTIFHNLLVNGWKDLLAFGSGINEVGLAFDKALLHPINTLTNIGNGLANGLMDTGYWAQRLYSNPKQFFPAFGAELKTELNTGWNITKKCWDILSVGDSKSYELAGKVFASVMLGEAMGSIGGALLDGEVGLSNAKLMSQQGMFRGAENLSLDSRNIQILDHSTINFSQTSVNNVDRITKSMKQYGWQGDPIEVVKLPNGSLVTVDNTRLLAASRANISVKAIVHDGSERLNSELAERFTTKRGGIPSTWEEAVLNRISKQSSLYRSLYPNGSHVIGANDL